MYRKGTETFRIAGFLLTGVNREEKKVPKEVPKKAKKGTEEVPRQNGIFML